MQSKTLHKKPSAKAPASNNTQTPYPNIITQVNKEDEKKYHILEMLNFYKCCSFFFRCFPSRKQSFSQITETTPSLLDPQLPHHRGRKCLVLDLDETLVHSTFEPVENPDLILPVRIQGMTYRINVIKRPGAEEFLARVGEQFEVVIFTASLAEYAEPLVRILDTTNAVSSLLYRQHCTPLNGVYVKDMSLLGRHMKDIILVDNSPNSFLFQPENAYHIKNFFDDKTDRELVKLAGFLDHMVEIDDVRPIEELRKKYEPKLHNKQMKFVKVPQEGIDLEEISSLNVNDPSKQALPSAKKKEKEDRERTYNVETEPDLRKDAREGEFQSYRSIAGASERNKNKPQYGYMVRNAPLTERIVNEKLIGGDLDSSDNIENIELPSPKESDALINHREADAFFENNSNDTDSKEGKKPKKNPSFLKSHSALYSNMNPDATTVLVEEQIEGHKVEDVRFLTGIDNLNSPLGRQVKIDFNKKLNVEA